MDMRIRDAIEADLPAIVDIDNQSIPAGWSTADTQPITVNGRVMGFRKFDPARRSIAVAEQREAVTRTRRVPLFSPSGSDRRALPLSHHGRGTGLRGTTSATLRTVGANGVDIWLGLGKHGSVSVVQASSIQRQRKAVESLTRSDGFAPFSTHSPRFGSEPSDRLEEKDRLAGIKQTCSDIL